MIRRAGALCLTVTALAPVGFAYSLVAALHCDVGTAVRWFSACVALSLLGWGLWRHVINRLERLPFKVCGVEVADDQNVAFLLLYLLPLVSGYTDGPPSWKIWLPIAAVMSVAILTSYSYHFNPMLGIMGWHFFKTMTPEGVTYVMITKRPLHSAGRTTVVVQLSEYIVVELGE